MRPIDGASLMVSCFSWNVQSINNKADKFLEHIEDANVDFGFVSETWLHTEKNDVTALVQDKGYKLRHVTRKNRDKELGGGVGILVRNTVKHKQIPCKQYTSFEHMMVSVKLNTGNDLVLITLYRLERIPPATFFPEFTELLESLCVMPENFIMSGDINFHLDDQHDTDVVRLNNIFDSFNCFQHVNQITHKRGHTLDFVLTRDQSPMISNLHVDDVNLSDHFLITFQAKCVLKQTVSSTFEFRDLKSIDIDKFRTDISNTLNLSNSNSFADKMNLYNNQLKSLLDQHAPLKRKTVKIVPRAPWFDTDYKEMRKKRRKAEKKYKQSKSSDDKIAFTKLRKLTTGLAFTKKQKYFSDQINQCSSKKSLYTCVNRLLDKSKTEVLPSHNSPKDLASKFNSFFKDKINDIRRQFPRTDKAFYSSTFRGTRLEVFRPATLDEIKSIVSKHGLKSSTEDPLPSKLLSLVSDLLIPVWLELVNLSLEQGSMDCLKSAVILPLLKGLDSVLDAEIFKNYRPVSTLQFLGKLIERIVGSRLDEHMDNNNLHCRNQYGYKKGHSTETLLVKIVNDLLLSCDIRIPTLIMLLDLSAAFDTVDQDKMLAILSEVFGICGVALKWFESFLKGRTQRVLVKDELSECETLDFGVAQGSILGPKLFNMYAHSFASTMQSKVNVNVDGYADDHQIQRQFSIAFQFNFLTEGITNIFEAAEEWMLDYFLKINSTKTLFIIVAPPSVMEQILIKGAFVNNSCIRFVTEAKNLGVVLDSFLCFNSQVKKVAKACFRTLRDLARIRIFLSKSDLQLLVCTLIFSQLDYCNALYYHLKSDTLHLLQSVQNSAARIVNKVNRFDRVCTTTLLKDLHWLQIKERIEYKILVIVHKCLYNNAPLDLSLTISKSLCERSVYLNVPTFHSSYGERSFSVAGPRLWNSLPVDIRNTVKIASFKKSLKTHLFKKCYNLY